MSVPLIAHIVFRLDYGGLENGVVNVINGLSTGEFHHTVIALTEATSFRERLHDDVSVYEIGKRPGKDPRAYLRLFRLLRTLKPAAVHTRNIGTLDCAFVAFLAGVPLRIHGEHGWDMFDADGTSPKYRRFRRLFSHFVQAFVAVSEELQEWLTAVIGVPAGKVKRICNGVDTRRFRPLEVGDANPLPSDFVGDGGVVVGCVTRFSEIKDPLNLVEAFIRLCKEPRFGESLRLIMIGDGELRSRALARLEEAGVVEAAWLPGSRDDIAELLRHMDLYVLGSRREGISNTILEAMASGLPVVATATGGNRELVEPGQTGQLVPPRDSGALAEAIAVYAADAELRLQHGRQSRSRALAEYSISTMIDNYRRLYNNALAHAGA